MFVCFPFPAGKLLKSNNTFYIMYNMPPPLQAKNKSLWLQGENKTSLHTPKHEHTALLEGNVERVNSSRHCLVIGSAHMLRISLCWECFY